MLKNTHKIVYLVFIFIFPFFLGCPYNPIPPSNNVIIFGWTRDGSNIIALKQAVGGGVDVATLNIQGKEIKKYHLQKLAYINDYYFSPKLFLAQNGNSFFAQINDDVYIIDVDNGSEMLFLPKEQMRNISSSGKLMLSSRLIGSDTALFSIRSIEGAGTRVIRTWLRTKSDSFTATFDKLDVSFIGDSLLIGCYADTGQCSLTVFDTLFRIKFKSNEHTGPFLLPSFSSGSGQVIYLATPNISLFDLQKQTSKTITSSLQYVTFLDISQNGDFFVYVVSNHPSYTFISGDLMLFDLKTNQTKKIMSGVASSGQISPDGKSVAFFTAGDNGGILHVVTVP
jgi:hypothetical protein